MEQTKSELRPAFNTRFGFYIAIGTALLTLLTFAIAIGTPPLSGPFCPEGCFEYPYHDIASRFPRDYLWMYPAMLVFLFYLLLMICIHRFAVDDKKTFSQIGYSFALLASGILISTYFLQVSVIQPSLLLGETDGIALMTQFNPHGVFIVLEEIGYIFMNLSFLAVVPVFSGRDRLKKAIRLTFIAGFVLAVFFFILITVKYGIMREYMFEVAIISIVYLQLIVSSFLIAVVFKKNESVLK